MIYICPIIHGQIYDKKMKIAEKIKEKNKTAYQQVAENIGVSVDFVGKIARGERIPIRGKGLIVRLELEKLITQ